MNMTRLIMYRVISNSDSIFKKSKKCLNDVADIILEDFDKLYAHFDGDIPKENLTQFVEEHFHDADQEMDVIMPDDFVKRYVYTGTQ